MVIGPYRLETWAEEEEGYTVVLYREDRLWRKPIRYKFFESAQEGAEEIAAWLREQLRLPAP